MLRNALKFGVQHALGDDAVEFHRVLRQCFRGSFPLVRTSLPPPLHQRLLAGPVFCATLPLPGALRMVATEVVDRLEVETVVGDDGGLADFSPYSTLVEPSRLVRCCIYRLAQVGSAIN